MLLALPGSPDQKGRASKGRALRGGSQHGGCSILIQLLLLKLRVASCYRYLASDRESPFNKWLYEL
jgi:hypothetical protein